MGLRGDEVRFAYLITVHHKPEQFEWLLSAIHDPRDIFLVHVDLKSRLGLKRDRLGVAAHVRRLAAGKPNVRLLPSRIVNWGGWSQPALTLHAIDRCLAWDDRWTHFVHLSGQCYPTKPLEEIRRRVAEAGERPFVELIPFSDLPPDDWHLQRRLAVETPARAVRLPLRRAPPKGFSLEHKGSNWVVLSRAFCEWQRTSELRRRVAAHLRFSHLSDELLFQALVVNGPPQGRVAEHYGRTVIWPGPKVLGMEDLPAILADPGLFGRKFDASVDADVLCALADACGFARPAVAAGLGR